MMMMMMMMVRVCSTGRVRKWVHNINRKIINEDTTRQQIDVDGRIIILVEKT